MFKCDPLADMLYFLVELTAQIYFSDTDYFYLNSCYFNTCFCKT